MKIIKQYMHAIVLGSMILIQIGSMLAPSLFLPEIAEIFLFAGLWIYSIWILQAWDRSLKQKYN